MKLLLAFLFSVSVSARVFSAPVIDVYGAVPVQGGTLNFPLYMAFVHSNESALVALDTSRTMRSPGDDRLAWYRDGDDILIPLPSVGTGYTNYFRGPQSGVPNWENIIVADLFTDGRATVEIHVNTTLGFSGELRVWVHGITHRRGLDIPLRRAIETLQKGNEPRAIRYLKNFQRRLHLNPAVSEDYKLRFDSMAQNIIDELEAD